MKKTVWIVILIVVLILIGVTLNKKDSSTKVTGEPIKIGMIAGLSGPYAAIGENYVKGAQLAIDSLNKTNSKVNMELIVENDDFDSKKSLSAYEKLVGIDKVNAIISETTSAIEAIYDRATTLGIPVIQGGEQSSDPTDDNVLQIQPGYYKAEIDLGEHVKTSGYKKIVTFVENYPAMLRFAKGFSAGYEGSTNQELVNFGDKDMRKHALKAFQSKPDAIVFLMFPDDGALLVKEINLLYKNSSVKPKLVLDANFQSGLTNYKNILGNLSVLDGSMLSIVQQETSADFTNSYKARWGEDPGLGADYGFDAVGVLAETYSKDNTKWVKNLKAVTFDGVGGEIKFDEVGVRVPNFKVTEIKGGEIVY